MIATGREQNVLEKLNGLGADDRIWLQQSDEQLVDAFRSALTGVDVVLDYLWGHSAECILAAAKGRGNPQGERRIRYVQIGSISGNAISLNADILRSTGVELMGSGLGSLSAAEIVKALTEMFETAASSGLNIDTEAVPLSEVESAWGRTESGRRMVFTI